MKAVNKIKATKCLPNGPSLKAGSLNNKKDRYVYDIHLNRFRAESCFIKEGDCCGIIPDGQDKMKWGKVVLDDKLCWLSFNDLDFCSIFFGKTYVERKPLTSGK